MTKFICKECSYKFESKLNQTGRKCPYCESAKIIKEPNAENLLRSN